MEELSIQSRLRTLFNFIIGFEIGIIICATVAYFVINWNKPKYEKIVSPLPTDFVIPTKKPVPKESPTPIPAGEYYKISYYDQSYCDKYNPKCITASGERFNDTDFTAACSSRHALGERHKIYYKGSSVIIRCNDRGGFEALGRDMDLSKSAFETLAPLSKGVIEVKIEEIN